MANTATGNKTGTPNPYINVTNIVFSTILYL